MGRILKKFLIEISHTHTYNVCMQLKKMFTNEHTCVTGMQMKN